jgi:hypothetical protein
MEVKAGGKVTKQTKGRYVMAVGGRVDKVLFVRHVLFVRPVFLLGMFCFVRHVLLGTFCLLGMFCFVMHVLFC